MIARQGEIGTGLFVVIEGAVRVVRDGEELARLGAGDFFGEMSVIDGLPRIAQVVTVDADALPRPGQLGVRAAHPRPPDDRRSRSFAVCRARLRSKTDPPRALSGAPPRTHRRVTDRCRPGRSPSSSPTSRARPRLAQSLDRALGRVLERHRELIRAAVAAHGGVEVKTEGDGFFVVFPRTRDAVAAVVDAQRALAAEPWPEDAPIRVRMGIHTGDGRLDADGEYVGADVHRAARVAAAGHGGQVLVSETTSSAGRGGAARRASPCAGSASTA